MTAATLLPTMSSTADDVSDQKVVAEDTLARSVRTISSLRSSHVIVAVIAGPFDELLKLLCCRVYVVGTETSAQGSWVLTRGAGVVSERFISGMST